jgi:hypothetical protein
MRQRDGHFIYPLSKLPSIFSYLDAVMELPRALTNNHSERNLKP